MNRCTRIIHVASGDIWAGAEAQLYELACEIYKSHTVELQIILFNHGILHERLLTAGINVEVLDEQLSPSLIILYRLIGLIHKFDADLVHTHGRKENVLGSIAAAVLRRKSLRTIHGAPEHHPSTNNRIKRLYGYLDSFCARHLQCRAIIVSQSLTTSALQLFGENNVSHIPNGINIDTITNFHNKGSIVTDRDDVFCVGVFTRLVPVKRLDILLDVAAYSDNNSDCCFRFFVVGDGPLRGKLDTEISARGLEGTVSVCGFDATPWPSIAAMDAIMVTSDHEGLPMIILEAMALETLVIAHAVGDIPELLDHGNAGCLVYQHSAKSYWNSLNTAYQDKSLSKEKVKSAKSHVTRHYAINRTMKSYLAAYEKILVSNIL